MFDLQHDNSDSVSPAERLATYLMTTWLPRLELISQGNTYLVAGPIKPFYSHTFIRHWNACVYEQTDAVAHLYELYAWTSTFTGMQKSDTQRQRHQKRDFQVANLERIKTSIFSFRLKEMICSRLHRNFNKLLETFRETQKHRVLTNSTLWQSYAVTWTFLKSWCCEPTRPDKA